MNRLIGVSVGLLMLGVFGVFGVVVHLSGCGSLFQSPELPEQQYPPDILLTASFQMGEQVVFRLNGQKGQVRRVRTVDFHNFGSYQKYFQPQNSDRLFTVFIYTIRSVDSLGNLVTLNDVDENELKKPL